MDVVTFCCLLHDIGKLFMNNSEIGIVEQLQGIPLVASKIVVQADNTVTGV